MTQESTRELTRLLEAWCKAEALPYVSADELQAQILADFDGDDASDADRKRQVDWLGSFITRWEEAQQREDKFAMSFSQDELKYIVGLLTMEWECNENPKAEALLERLGAPIPEAAIRHSAERR